MWLGTGEGGGGGILIFDPVSKKLLKHIKKDASQKNTLTSNDISSLFREKNNTIWVTTWDAGISKVTYDKNLNIFFENFRKDLSNGDKKGLVSDIVTSIIKDSKGNLWISTQEGISIFNSSKTEIFNLTSNSIDPNSLKESNSWVVFEDQGGIIWVGHKSVGISKLRNNKGFIRIMQSNQSTSLPGNNISAIQVDLVDNIWVGLVDRGLYRINFNGNYLTPPAIKAFPTDFRVNSILSYSKKNTWIGANGLYRLNTETSVFQLITQAKDFGALVMDSAKNLWSANYDGLFKIDRIDLTTSGAKISPVLPDSRLKSQQQDVNFSGIMEDPNKKRVWMTNWQGEIFFYDLRNKRPYMPTISTSVKVDFDKARISTFYIAKKDYLWVATLAGLFKYKIIENDEPDKIALHLEKVYGQNEGLVTLDGRESLNIHSIQDDNHGNLWIAHTGLSVLNPVTDFIKTYYMNDGLPSNQFLGKAKLKNGFLVYGSNNGIILFHPDSLKDNTIPPKIVITNFQIVNRSVSFNESATKSKNEFILPQSIPYTKEVTIDHDQNVLEFEYSALDFKAPERNQYAYQMVGFDNDWVYSGNKRTITYTNLDPGTYTFRVKGSNNDGVWNEEGTSLQIIILPPPWKTWWAYLLYTIVLLSATYVLWNRWITRSRLKTLALIKSAEADKLRELDTLKSRFFANISHEFRTPLTLILGPLEKRLSTTHDQTDKKELSVMYRNASRLLTLINQLLDFSRLEAGTLKLKCHHADMQPALRSIASQFSSMADSKEIHFGEVVNQPVALFFDQDKLEKIVSNLLSNAFKFTAQGGTITLTLSQHPTTPEFNQGYAEIIVRDTGTGIPAEHLPKIFERFYQVDMSNTRAYEGAGIGLSLTKELVDLHHGTIEVRSEIGKGSVFTVHLPLGKDHLKPDEISSISEEDLTSTEPISPPEEILILQEQDHVLLQESILIIEDNSDLRSYMRNEFQHSYKMLEAADGEEGMAIAIKEIPTLIITDLMMPKKDGLSVCHELKGDERTSHIPIILLTAKADIDSKLKGYQEGADDYISKPFNLVELRVRIQNLITIRKQLQAKFAQPVTVLPSAIATGSADGRFLKRAVEIVEVHLTDSNFGVELLAHEMNVSQTQLYRKLQAVTGSGPNEFIRHIRLHYAANLLRNKAGNVSEVAYQAGFNNLSYFSKVFKEKFGVTPIEFLKNPILQRQIKS